MITWSHVKIEHFDLYNILIEEKLCENVLLSNISYKKFDWCRKNCVLYSKKEKNSSEFMIELDI